MTILRTDRLVLRPWRQDSADVEFLFDLYSRWEVQRFLGTRPRVMARHDEALERVTRWRAIEDGVRGAWAVTRSDEPLGTLLLKHIPWSAGACPAKRAQPEDVEIGWHFHPDAWGHGYASEAACAVLSHGFAAGLTRVVAVTNPANAASQAVCRRIGMVHRGITSLYYNVDCELFDVDAGHRAR